MNFTASNIDTLLTQCSMVAISLTWALVVCYLATLIYRLNLKSDDVERRVWEISQRDAKPK